MPPDTLAEVGGRVLTLSNLDKILYPSGFAKAEVISYYHAIAPVLLPHLRDRAVTRVRFPNGTAEASFFEKNAPAGTPEWVRTCRVTASRTPIDYLVVDEQATLVLLANQAALELHTPQWRIADQPPEPFVVDGTTLADQVMVDLDPGPGVTMAQTATAALEVANELAAEGLVPVAKTSGGKGLQVLAAIRPTPAERVLDAVRHLAVTLTQRHPERYVATQARDQREGRILVDWLQNQSVRNTISVYSLRGRERPTVSTPLAWDEVGAATHGAPLDFSPADVLGRVARFGDLAADLLPPERPPLRGEPGRSLTT